ncbi:hypothetical protein [Blastopirellula marina]|uniref:Uncharacterized protein n=1 Tax=Blastopirellula marina TaxID=124 RepID=A0A2S8GP76_9BACT|nr:hypothetical protein [Blastopirellula marina]PQO46225.1 hypothetical protein C5Y93_09570 [Blastopirellula marina]
MTSPSDNPFASPQGLDEEEINAQLVPDPQTSKKQPPTPDSILMAWMLGVVLIPMQIVCFSFFGLVLIAPLFCLLAYLPTRARWVWSTAIVFFLVEVLLLGATVVLSLGISISTITIVLVISVALCLMIIACLCRRSAWEHYHRTEA